ncbi:MAG: error-prone DNA polymerase [Rhizorhabdus sp.]|uniref:error-prone DNA polymerase n=1 Tax=Rhizorhabdus sp. TaxID=1968843 RepID=UPI001B732778|nr:error-prone DNA polymerase [Rhizorhabdus sp.]MBP8232120.1 error-prone DNA polymerase [Rhizorhabdus sp.]
MSYAELQITSNYSFLRGASHPDELGAAAAALGLPAIGITDRNSLAGLARMHVAARNFGLRLVPGCRLDLLDGSSVLVYPTDRAAYGRLCRLLTVGKARAGKGGCALAWGDVEAAAEGLICVLVPDEPGDLLELQLARLRAAFSSRAYVALTLRRRPGDALRLHRIATAAAAARIPTVATGDVLYHAPDRRILQDLLTAIRHGCTIDDLGTRRERFADRHLQSPAEMSRLFGRYPEAIERSLEIAERCAFSLDQLSYQYPDEIAEPGVAPQQTLEAATWAGAARRYPEGVPASVADQIRRELALIDQLAYAPYFLTVNAIVRFARGRGILCQGRGSAANSAVCYVLGITAIDPTHHDLLFERFISVERNEPPDIDVDFEHERREEVIQHIYETYGHERAALTATVIRYRTRGAMRDVAKALGLSAEVSAALVRRMKDDGTIDADDVAVEFGGDRRVRIALELAEQIRNFPRHLSQHPGGFVLTRDRLDELVPIEPAAMDNRSVIEWDKDDIDALKFMKIDILALGMLSCIRRALDYIEDHKDMRIGLADIPTEDPATYDMICRADTVGVFQIESRAQMAMLPRIRPRTFYDLVIEVAIVRPGPIQGDMVHPYLRRREGREPVDFPHPDLERVLGRTLGVPLFQEQAMRIAIVCAGFSGGEADQLRRSMATFKLTGGVSRFQERLVSGMVERGYPREFAEKVFAQIQGFGAYGFPESHAASFALIAYASAWLKCHHPEVFCAALLNSQPMGFYAPAQIVRDAREHGVEIRPIDINASRWDCGLEPTAGGRLAVRLGFRLVLGLASADALRLVLSRADRPFSSVEDLWRRAGVPVAALTRLADADAFRPSMGLARRDAIWAIRGLRDEELPLFAAAAARERVAVPEAIEPPVTMKHMTAGAEVVADYSRAGLTLRKHPLWFLRQDLARRGTLPCSDLRSMRDGRRVAIAGLVLVRQRPASAAGVTFVTIEDETGVANLVVWEQVGLRLRGTLLAASLLGCRGRVQREGDVIHLVADDLLDHDDLLRSLSLRDGERSIPEGPAVPASASLPSLSRDFR